MFGAESEFGSSLHSTGLGTGGRYRLKPEENDLPLDPELEAFWKRVLFWSLFMSLSGAIVAGMILFK
jgi:hypothetical protein